MRIGIDIDGVLYPWTDVANEALMAKFDIPNPGPHRHWNWLKEQITREQWSWLWSKEGQRTTFAEWRRTYPGVVEAFGAVLKSGHECHFVTHRDPRRTATDTGLFLEHNFGAHPWAGLHVIQASTAKHSLAEWDVFVDDKPETVIDMLIHTRAQVFAPVRPWNSGLPITPRLLHYADPREVAEWVLAQ